MKTSIRLLSGIVIAWLVIELVVFLVWGILPWFDSVVFYLGLALVVTLAVISMRDRDRTVAERQLVTRLVAASILTAAAMMSADPFGYRPGNLAVLVVVLALVLTFMATVSHVRYVRGEPASGPSAAWRVAGAVLVVLIGLPITLLAGALAGLVGFSCSGGVIGEGCGGGSWLPAIIVWTVLGCATIWSAWLVARSGYRSSATSVDR